MNDKTLDNQKVNYSRCRFAEWGSAECRGTKEQPGANHVKLFWLMTNVQNKLESLSFLV